MDHKRHLAEIRFLTPALLLSWTIPPVWTVRGDGAVSLQEKLGLPGGTAILSSEAGA